MTTHKDPKQPPAEPRPASDHNAEWDADDGEAWRHAPVAPKDKGVLDSIGESVSEGLTGADSRKKSPPPGRG